MGHRMPGERYRNGGPRQDLVAALAQQGAIELPVPEAQPKPAAVVFTFDGFEFNGPWPLQIVSILYWAYKARRGDEAACEMMKTFQWGVADRHGKSYWPMEQVLPASEQTETPSAAESV